MTLDQALVDALAVYRLTRLATRDHITRDARAAIVASAYEAGDVTPRGSDRWTPGDWLEHVENDENPPPLAKLVTCSWCSGVWIAAGVTLARAVVPGWDTAARILALAGVAGWLASQE